MTRSLEEQIIARSHEVQRLGAYIGTFELVVWSVLADVDVLLVVGGSVHSMRQLFLPSRLTVPTRNAAAHVFVASNLSLSRQLMAVDTTGWAPRFGHFVAGTCLKGVKLDPSTSIGPIRGSESLRAACLRMGVGVVETQAAGDCGIDTMCYHVGCTRDVSEFKKVRARLAGFMQLHACEVEWQTCFKACDECDMNPTTGKATAPGVLTQDGDPSVGTSGAASSGSQGPAKSGKAPVSVSKRSRLAEFFERPYDLGTVLKKRVVASATQPSASRAAPATGPSSTITKVAVDVASVGTAIADRSLVSKTTSGTIGASPPLPPQLDPSVAVVDLCSFEAACPWVEPQDSRVPTTSVDGTISNGQRCLDEVAGDRHWHIEGDVTSDDSVPTAVVAVASTEDAVVLYDEKSTRPKLDPSCRAVCRVGQSMTVHEWLKSLPPEELSAVTVDYGTFAVAKAEWLATVPRAPRLNRGSSKGAVNRVSKMDHRIAIGIEYFNWLKTVSTDVQGVGVVTDVPVRHRVSEFCKHKWTYGRVVPRAVKMWVSRCIKAGQAVSTGRQVWKTGSCVRRHKFALVPRPFRMRAYGLQGRPVMAPMLREALFDWFLSVRASVKARIPQRMVLSKAKAVATDLLGRCVERVPSSPCPCWIAGGCDGGAVSTESVSESPPSATRSSVASCGPDFGQCG